MYMGWPRPKAAGAGDKICPAAALTVCTQGKKGKVGVGACALFYAFAVLRVCQSA